MKGVQIARERQAIDGRKRVAASRSPSPLSAMKHRISAKSDHLVAQLLGRETAEEMQAFLRAVVAENRTYRRPFIFIDIRASRPLFNVERPGLFDCFKELSIVPSCKIALLGDTDELCISHDYLAFLAEQQGLNVRSFRSKAAVFGWLNERRKRQDRRLRKERRLRQERRQQQLRRANERRAGIENRRSSR
jgi:hypothetical protein